MKYS
jgi:hypothetical protein